MIENRTDELVDLAKVISRKNAESISWLLLTADKGVMKEKEDLRKQFGFQAELREYSNLEVSKLENKTVSHSKPLQMAKVGKVRNDSGKRSNAQ